MKKLFVFLFLTMLSQVALANGYPVLKVVLKGGLSERVESVVSDLKNRPGAGTWCFDYVQQTLGNLENDKVEFGSYLILDVTDYRISNELMEYAQNEIIKNHLKGTFTREVPDALTGCKRVYVLTWLSKNKFGDKGSINIIKLDSPSCMQSLVS